MATVGRVQGSLINVPAGGTTGQALIKNSGADNDLAWRTPTPLEPTMQYQSGYWYCAGQRFFAGSNTMSIAAPKGFYCPAYIFSGVTVNAIGFNNSDFAGAITVNVGVSECLANGKPGTLLASATVSAPSINGWAGSIANTTLRAGWIYLYVGFTAGTGGLNTATYLNSPVLPCGDSSAAPSSGPPLNVFADTTGVPVSLPSSATATALTSAPLVCFRVV